MKPRVNNLFSPALKLYLIKARHRVTSLSPLCLYNMPPIRGAEDETDTLDGEQSVL